MWVKQTNAKNKNISIKLLPKLFLIVVRFNGSRAILSGPAGGVVGYAMTTYHKETTLPIIGFDMGGTSTDVSRYGGSYEHVYESTTAGVTIQAAQVTYFFSTSPLTALFNAAGSLRAKIMAHLIISPTNRVAFATVKFRF